MSDNDFTPSAGQVRSTYALADGDEYAEYRKVSFDRWLVEHDAALVSGIVMRVRQNCTPPAYAYNVGGDVLVAAVADWIENPPAWVDAPWRSQPAPVGTPGTSTTEPITNGDES